MKKKLSLILSILLILQLIPAWSVTALASGSDLTTLEESSSELKFEGQWSKVNGGYHNGKAVVSSSASASVSFSFTGTGFRYIGSQEPGFAKIDIIVDGNKSATVDANASKAKNKVVLYETDNLVFGRHDVRITPAAGSKSVNNKPIINVDRIEYFTEAPEAPNNIKADLTNDGVSISWKTVKDVVGYRVYRSVKGVSEPVLLTSSPITANSFIDSSWNNQPVQADMNVSYLVSSVSALGAESDLSSSKNVWIPKNTVSTPKGLLAKANKDRTVTLQWNSVDQAQGYNVYRSDSKDGTYEKVNVDSVVSSNSFKDIEINSRFFAKRASVYYKVSSVGLFNESDLSSDVSVEVDPTPGPDKITSNLSYDDSTDLYLVNLQWSSVEGAVGYQVFVKKSTDKSFVPLDDVIVSGGIRELSIQNVSLTTDAKYEYAVAAVNRLGQLTALSDPTSVNIPKNTAATPTGIRATNTNNVINLEWNASSNAVGYQVFRSESLNKNYTLISGNDWLKEPKYTDASFADLQVPVGKLFFYKVQAVNKFGQTSDLSSPITVYRKAPQRPNNVLATVNDQAIEVNWSDVVGASAYKIYVTSLGGSKLIELKSAKVTESQYVYVLEESHRPNDVRYFITVTTVDKAGNESLPSNLASVIVPNTVPSKPSQLQAVNNNNVIQLTWTAALNADGYKVYRSNSTDSSSFKVVNSTPVQVEEFKDQSYIGANFDMDVNVYYRVATVNRYGIESKLSDIVHVVLTKPNGPEIVDSALINDVIKLKWDSVQGASGYRVYRSTQENSGYVAVNNEVLQLNQLDDPISATTLFADTEYYYVVKSVDSEGRESKPSIPKKIVLPSNAASIPVGVEATVKFNNVVQLKWMASANAVHYNVFRSKIGGEKEQIATEITETSVVDTVVIGESAEFEYSVTAVNRFGTESDASNPVIASVLPPAVPQAVTVTSTVYNTFELSWLPTDNAAGYRIYRSDSPNSGFVSIGSTDPATTSFAGVLASETLYADTVYYYAVSALYASSYESALAVAPVVVPANAALTPAGLNASIAADNSVLLTWQTSDHAVGYNIYRKSIAEGSSFQQLNVGGLITTETYTDIGLSNRADVLGQGFVYAVRAVNAFSTESDPAEAAIQMLMPIVPSGVTATYLEANEDITVQWQESMGALGYSVYRSEDGENYNLLTPEPIQATSFVDTSFHRTISEGVTVYYVVTASYYPGFTTDKSTPVTVFVPTNTASAPEQTSIQLQDGVVTIKWEAASKASSYHVYRKSGNGEYQQLTSSGAIPETTFTDSLFTGSIRNTEVAYAYAISSLNAYGSESGKSTDVSVVLPASPKLQLAAVCSNEPTKTRKWLVKNSNPFAVTFTAKLVGTNIATEFTVGANGELTVEMATQASTANVLEIYVDGVQHASADNIGAECPKGPALVSAVATSSTTVELTFDKPIDITTGQVVSNYSIFQKDGSQASLIVTAAVVNSNKVVLSTAPQKAGMNYELTVSGEVLGVDLLPVLLGSNKVNFVGKSSILNFDPGIIQNGDFEEYSGLEGVANSWTKIVTSALTSEFKLVSSPVFSGNAAQQISASGLSNGGTARIVQFIPTIEPNKIYRVGSFVNALSLSDSKVQMYVEFYDASSTLISATSKEISNVTNGFEKLDLEFRTPANVNNAKVYIILKGTNSNGSGTVVVDSLSMTKQENILFNGSFENYTGSTGLADNWTKSISSGITDTLSLVNSPVFNGMRAQKIELSGLTNGATARIQQTVPIEGNKLYSLSGKFNIESLRNAKVQLYVDFLDANRSTISAKSQELLGTTSNYTTMAMQFRAPINAVNANFFIIVRGTDSNGAATLIVDSINFVLEKNQLLNGNFEFNTVTNGLADNWFKSSSTGVIEDMQLITAPTNDGSYAQKITTVGMSNGAMSRIFQSTSVEGNKLYSVSGMIFAQKLINTKVQVYIDYQDSSGTVLGAKTQEILNTTNGFTALSQSFWTPANATSVRVFIIIRGTGANGEASVIVDSLSLINESNIVMNGGFESFSGTSGVADNWFKSVPAGVVESITPVNNPVQSGNKAQKIAVSGLGSGQTAQINSYIPTIQAERYYTLKSQFSVEKLDNAKVQLMVYFYDANNQVLSTTFKELSTVTNGYVPVNNIFKTPANSKSARVYILIRSTGPNGEAVVYVDSISIE